MTSLIVTSITIRTYFVLSLLIKTLHVLSYFSQSVQCFCMPCLQMRKSGFERVSCLQSHPWEAHRLACFSYCSFSAFPSLNTLGYQEKCSIYSPVYQFSNCPLTFQAMFGCPYYFLCPHSLSLLHPASVTSHLPCAFSPCATTILNWCFPWICAASLVSWLISQ